MPVDTIFTIVNNAVLPFWLLLVILPHHKVTNVLVHSGIVPVLYGLIYTAYLVGGMMAGGPEGASMTSLDGLMAGFSTKDAVLTGWVHYLVFDLFIGAWIVRDARRVDIPHLAVIIPVIATLMAGPLGLMLYITIRWFWKKRFGLNEELVAAS